MKGWCLKKTTKNWGGGVTHAFVEAHFRNGESCLTFGAAEAAAMPVTTPSLYTLNNSTSWNKTGVLQVCPKKAALFDMLFRKFSFFPKCWESDLVRKGRARRMWIGLIFEVSLSE